MSATKILDGNKISEQIAVRLRRKVEEVSATVGRAPGLAVILLGENPASRSYVKRKTKVAGKCGFKTFDAFMPASCSAKELTKIIEDFNNNQEVDGILLQLPLPDHLESDSFLMQLLPSKDADGLHPQSQGKLIVGSPGFRPCTPLGVLTLIDFAFNSENLEEPPQKDLSGKRVVVIGRSRLVGKPLALMLLERNATVSVLHSRSPEPHLIAREADILVAAVGKEHLVNKDWIKPGAVVIDVGINRTTDGKLTGDVDFNGVKDLCSAITPVPGGVGPMTVISLMENTFKSFCITNEIS